MVALDKQANSYARSLSGGMKRRLLDRKSYGTSTSNFSFG